MFFLIILKHKCKIYSINLHMKVKEHKVPPPHEPLFQTIKITAVNVVWLFELVLVCFEQHGKRSSYESLFVCLLNFVQMEFCLRLQYVGIAP